MKHKQDETNSDSDSRKKKKLRTGSLRDAFAKFWDTDDATKDVTSSSSSSSSSFSKPKSDKETKETKETKEDQERKNKKLVYVEKPPLSFISKFVPKKKRKKKETLKGQHKFKSKAKVRGIKIRKSDKNNDESSEEDTSSTDDNDSNTATTPTTPTTNSNNKKKKDEPKNNNANTNKNKQPSVSVCLKKITETTSQSVVVVVGVTDKNNSNPNTQKYTNGSEIDKKKETDVKPAKESETPSKKYCSEIGKKIANRNGNGQGETQSHIKKTIPTPSPPSPTQTQTKRKESTETNSSGNKYDRELLDPKKAENHENEREPEKEQTTPQQKTKTEATTVKDKMVTKTHDSKNTKKNQKKDKHPCSGSSSSSSGTSSDTQSESNYNPLKKKKILSSKFSGARKKGIRVRKGSNIIIKRNKKNTRHKSETITDNEGSSSGSSSSSSSDEAPPQNKLRKKRKGSVIAKTLKTLKTTTRKKNKNKSDSTSTDDDGSSSSSSSSSSSDSDDSDDTSDESDNNNPNKLKQTRGHINKRKGVQAWVKSGGGGSGGGGKSVDVLENAQTLDIVQNKHLERLKRKNKREELQQRRENEVVQVQDEELDRRAKYMCIQKEKRPPEYDPCDYGLVRMENKCKKQRTSFGHEEDKDVNKDGDEALKNKNQRQGQGQGQDSTTRGRARRGFVVRRGFKTNCVNKRKLERETDSEDDDSSEEAERKRAKQYNRVEYDDDDDDKNYCENYVEPTEKIDNTSRHKSGGNSSSSSSSSKSNSTSNSKSNSNSKKKNHKTRKQKHETVYQPPDLHTLPKAQRDFIEKYILLTPEEIALIATYEQGSDEWKQSRIGRLGGSSYCKAVGHSPYGSPHTLLQDMMYPKNISGRHLDRGHRLEPLARALLLQHERTLFMEELTRARRAKEGVVKYRNRYFSIPDDVDCRSIDDIFNITVVGGKIHPLYPWIISSNDGDIWIFGEKKGICEFKAPEKRPTMMKRDYYDQVQGNMEVHDVSFCLFVDYLEGDTEEQLNIDLYEYDRVYCRRTLLPALHRFWFRKYLRERVKPSNLHAFLEQFNATEEGKRQLDTTDMDVESLKRRYNIGGAADRTSNTRRKQDFDTPPPPHSSRGRGNGFSKFNRQKSGGGRGGRDSGSGSNHTIQGRNGGRGSIRNRSSSSSISSNSSSKKRYSNNNSRGTATPAFELGALSFF